MVRKAKRLLGVSAFYLFLSLLLFGCSGQQQSEEEVEVSEQGEQGAEEENQEAEGQQGDNSADAESQGEGNNAGGEAVAQATEEAATEPATGTENDLQEIIQEMNGQPATNGGAVPLAQNAGGNQPAPATPEPVTEPAPGPSAPTLPSGPPPQGSSAIPFQPGGTPAGQGLPELGSKMAYVVEKGDTLGKISQKIFGNPGRWKELAELSGITNPSRIFPGDLVYYTLEEGAVSFAQAYEATTRSEETVKTGDTLATIAKRVYGTTTGWRALWRQNDKIDNPDIVPPGTTIYYLPQGAAVAAAGKVNSNFNNSYINDQISSFKLTTKNPNNRNTQSYNHKISTLSKNKIESQRINVINAETIAKFHDENHQLI